MSSSIPLRVAIALAVGSIGATASAQGVSGQMGDHATGSVHRPEATLATSLPSGMTPAPKPPVQKRDTPWRTKEELLAAARSGEFKGLPEIRANQEEETAPMTDSVIHILRHEYDVPSLSTGQSAGSMTCRSAASAEIRRLFTAITALHVDTLSNQPPAFYQNSAERSDLQNIEVVARILGNGDGLCSSTVMGTVHPHPYGAALRQLADEFGRATREYVDSERARRKTAYDEEQARLADERKAKAEAEAKRAAAARAAEQRRIDSERARIQSRQPQQPQQQQQQQQQGRIAG